MSKQIDIRQFKTWCRQNAGLAQAVVLAQAFAEVERERVDAYVGPIFAKYEFYTDLMAEHGGERERITVPKDLYLSKDEELCEAYYAECDAAHRAHGFKGPEGHCPALTAENLKIQAQNALIEEGAKLFGIRAAVIWGEDRKKFLDLLLGACLKAAKEVA